MNNQPPRTLIITRKQPQTADIVALSALPHDTPNAASHNFDFIAGQVAVLQTPNQKLAYFALSSAPEDSQLEFLIKRGSPAANAIADLETGAQLELTGIVGKGFPLDDLRGRDLVLIAMGTGIAPLRSALRYTFAHRTSYGKIFTLYGARTPLDFCYTDETEAWRTHDVDLRLVISRPENHDWAGATGYVQSLLDNVLPDLQNPTALVCGSGEMIKQTRERLIEMGFNDNHVLTNY